MIRHCVYLNLASDHDPAELQAVLTGLAALCAEMPGARGFVHGPNRDFEGKSQAYASGFTVDFEDAAALQAYAEDPAHQALGARLCDCCAAGYDGIIVFDLEV